LLFVRLPRLPATLASNPATAWIGALWRNAWGFDAVYDRLLVRPFVGLSVASRNDPFDGALGVVPETLRALNTTASATQTGNLRWYAAVAGLGLCALLGWVAFT
jgi:NADH-quinone oxidoreductase subunit L